MKKKFAKLTKREQERVEAEYHRMNPEDFGTLVRLSKFWLDSQNAAPACSA